MAYGGVGRRSRTGLAEASQPATSAIRRRPGWAEETSPRLEWSAPTKEAKIAENDPPIAKVSTVFVPVSDQNEALKFYTDKLGFEVRTDVAYEENQRWLEVSPPGAETTVALVPPREGHQDPEGIDTNVGFGTDDVAAAHADLGKKGVDTDDIISPGDPVPSMFFFRDQDGNRFVIAEEND